MARPDQSDRPLTWLEPVLAVLVLAYLWLDVWVGVRWLPTWAYLGPVTLPWTVLPPMVLGAVTMWRLARRTGTQSGRSRWRLGIGVLAALTLLGGLYAIVNLNVAKPGVFFASILPIAFGFLLSVAVLLDAGIRYRDRRRHTIRE